MDKILGRARQCLDETGWTHWLPRAFLGAGANSIAVLLVSVKTNKEAVLLMERHDKTLLPWGAPTVLAYMNSGVHIRYHFSVMGIPVPETIEAPKLWSGGAALVMSRVPGRDIHQILTEGGVINPGPVAKKVAGIIQTGWNIEKADPNHSKGWGKHLFGQSGPFSNGADVFADYLSPIMNTADQDVVHLAHQVQEIASIQLLSTPRATCLWDVSERNLMLCENGNLVGVVDQVDLWSGDPMFIPGTAMAMLADVNRWPGVDEYEYSWRNSWGCSSQEWQRVSIHRLGTFGRWIGRRAKDPGKIIQDHVERWKQQALELISTSQ